MVAACMSHWNRAFLLCSITLLLFWSIVLAQAPLTVVMTRVSQIRPANVPCAASITMTVIGPGKLQVGGVYQGFGDLPSLLKIRVQGSACSKSEWLSESSALCKTTTAGFDAAAASKNGQIFLTMQTNLQFTLLQAFSFDLPVVSDVVSGNAPTYGGREQIF